MESVWKWLSSKFLLLSDWCTYRAYLYRYRKEIGMVSRQMSKLQSFEVWGKDSKYWED